MRYQHFVNNQMPETLESVVISIETGLPTNRHSHVTVITNFYFVLVRLGVKVKSNVKI
jgi:hypothetical protein